MGELPPIMSYTIINVIKDFITGNLEFVSTVDTNSRFNICKECEVFNTKLKTCTICGCYMPIKTKLVKSACPMEKW